MTAFPAPRRIPLAARRLPGGAEAPPITLSVHEAGSGPAVVLCHGFPELAYSWRHQLPALAAAGFRAIAPDQRGYGASDRPEPIPAYDIHHLTGDLVGLLDALEVERAVFVGHDWGGLVVWPMAVLHPARVAGVVGVNTPNLPRSPMKPTEMMRLLVNGQDEKMYVLWFQKPGVADAVLAANTRAVFEKLLRGGVSPAEATARSASMGFEPGDMNPFRRLAELPSFGDPIVEADALDHFVRTFERTGFTGGINWYRNMDRNWGNHPGRRRHAHRRALPDGDRRVGSGAAPGAGGGHGRPDPRPRDPHDPEVRAIGPSRRSPREAEPHPRRLADEALWSRVPLERGLASSFRNPARDQ